jgi:hypothetical protein
MRSNAKSCSRVSARSLSVPTEFAAAPLDTSAGDCELATFEPQRRTRLKPIELIVLKTHRRFLRIMIFPLDGQSFSSSLLNNEWEGHLVNKNFSDLYSGYPADLQIVRSHKSVNHSRRSSVVWANVRRIFAA